MLLPRLASLIGHLGSSAFRLSTTTVSMSLAGSCFSSESAPRPFHHGIRGRGGTIFRAALPSIERQVQADMRTHLIHRPARDIFHRSVDSSFLLSGLILNGFHAAAAACFSNRPFGVKRFQTIHYHSVDVARGLVLLFGIGTKALPSWDSRTGWNNLSGGLTVNRTAGPSGHANSPHPSSREGHLPPLGGLEFSPIGFDPERFSCCCRGLLPGPPELGTINPDAVHDDG